ncbi:MAG: pirin family protein [Fibrobacter sp.]|nr:pirin family protein [Fibrobacter sp.]
MARRTVKKIYHPKHSTESTGIRTQRIFSVDDVNEFDPFLLLDDFSSDDSANYKKGFPWHPHRGMESITYVIKGDLKHGDSLGNYGYISTGDVQWMTAGSGIIHQEMPRGSRDGTIEGFQIWANLPSTHKMIEPRYLEIPSDAIPEIQLENGNVIRVIAGSLFETSGPVTDIITEPVYLDIQMVSESEMVLPTNSIHNAFIYVFRGSCVVQEDNDPLVIEEKSCVLFSEGDEILIKTGNDPARIIFVSGKPIGERVVSNGPIVMNTEDELSAALKEYENNVFVKISN